MERISVTLRKREVTTWSDDRLRRLFERYHSRYWPRSRRLLKFTIINSKLDGPWGLCDYDRLTLFVDIACHPADREVRETVLHEMIHAAVGKGGHGAAFWTQLEYLLSEKAPIRVDFPELGEQGQHSCVIPPRFRRCRGLFEPIYRRQQRKVDKETAGIKQFTYTTGQLEIEVYDAAVAGVRWRAVWTHYERMFGWIDLDGRLLPWARNWHTAARKGYLRGRRFLLENERVRTYFQSLPDENLGRAHDTVAEVPANADSDGHALDD